MKYSLKNDLQIVTSEQVPFEFREKNIIYGYRRPNSSFIACIKSLFSIKCNETFNFWTHFIPAILVYNTLIEFIIENEINNFTLPFVIYLITAGFNLLMSSLAHAFNCMSSVARHLCFMLDYIAIGIFGLGICIGVMAYSLSLMPHYTYPLFKYYSVIVMIVIMASSVMMCASRFVLSFTLRTILRITPFALSYSFIIFPVFLRLLLTAFPALDSLALRFFKLLFKNINSNDNENVKYLINISNDSNFNYFIHLLLVFSCAFLYASHISFSFKFINIFSNKSIKLRYDAYETICNAIC